MSSTQLLLLWPICATPLLSDLLPGCGVLLSAVCQHHSYHKGCGCKTYMFCCLLAEHQHQHAATAVQIQMGSSSSTENDAPVRLPQQQGCGWPIEELAVLFGSSWRPVGRSEQDRQQGREKTMARFTSESTLRGCKVICCAKIACK